MRFRIGLAEDTIPGYETIIAKPKDSGRVRIIAFVSKKLNFEVRSDLMSNDLSTIWIEIKRAQQKNVLCGGIYREWTTTEPEDLQKICSQVKKASKEKKSLVLIGDINLDADQWDEPTFYRKSLADVWKSEMAWRGLQKYNLGVTYVSYYTKNGKKQKVHSTTSTQKTQKHSQMN